MKKYFRIAAAMLAMCSATFAAAQTQPVQLFHIHGLAYSVDGATLYVPAHFGLVVFRGGRWAKAPGPEHDYMGFNATADAFYSSGHPAQGSGLVNPFGLIKSTDAGRTWQSLGMTGESDFHVAAAGYRSNAVYVFNMAPNSNMPTAGLYYTTDDGRSWQHAQGQGIPEPRTLAVHPTDIQQVAVGGEGGVFMSWDKGNSFRPLETGANVYMTHFDLDGSHLWYGGTKFSPFLAKLNLETGENSYVALPPLGRDAVDYMAQNPARPDEYVISTFQRNVYRTRDGGATWEALAKEGDPLPVKP